MPRALLISLLLAGFGGAAQAQDGGYSDPQSGDYQMPSLILPHDMTAPALSGADPSDAGQGGADAYQPESYEPAPYSVEGEETLDPGGN